MTNKSRAPRRLFLIVALLFTATFAFAGGRQEVPPSISLAGSAGRVYLAPGSDEDGAVTEIEIRAEATPGSERVVMKKYGLEVFAVTGDNAGSVVWAQSDAAPPRGLFGPGEAITLPESWTWDGTYLGSGLGSDGDPVPDGDYSYQVYVEDSQGQRVSSAPRVVTVDTTPPAIRSISADRASFSPNGDGILDTVTIRQSTARAVEWVGEIIEVETEEVVWTSGDAWSNVDGGEEEDSPAPFEFVWDGTRTDGSPAAPPESEVEYRYRLTGVDRARNRVVSTDSVTLGFVLNTKQPEVMIAADKALYSASVDDDVTLTLDIGSAEGIAAWSVDILAHDDTAGVPLWTSTGTGEPQPELTYGFTDRFNRRVSDGTYVARFDVLLDNGTGDQALTEPFVVDSTPPAARLDLAAGTPTIGGSGSPNPSVQIAFVERERLGERPTLPWTLSIVDATGEVVYEAGLSEIPDPPATAPIVQSVADNRFVFNGDGLDDGVYRFSLSAVDAAGNPFGTDPDDPETVAVAVDRRTPVVNLSWASQQPTEFVAIPPMGLDEPMRFSVTAQPADLLDNFQLDVVAADAPDVPLRRFAGSTLAGTRLRDVYTFDGRYTRGQPVLEGMAPLPDGDYLVRFTVQFVNGYRVETDPLHFASDSTPPAISGFSLQSDPTPTDAAQLATGVIFGGAQKSDLVLNVAAIDYDEPWTVLVTDEDGAEVIREELTTIFGEDARFPLLWPRNARPGYGTDLLPRSVGLETLRVQLIASDQAGNTAETPRRTAILDRRERDASVAVRGETSDAVGGVPLSPGGDAGADVVRVDTSVAVLDYLTEFVFEVVAEDGTVYFRSSTPNQVLPSFNWDGTRTNGIDAPDGVYRVRLRAAYRNGDSVQVADDRPIVLSRERPRVVVSAEGNRFSPNGDGDADTIRIRHASATEAEWTGRIVDADGESVRTYSWSGTPEDIVWDGTDESGDPAADGVYTYEIVGTNRIGNVYETQIARGIQLDTLTDAVSIRIAMETFSPDNDGLEDELRLSPRVGRPDAVNDWAIEIVNADGQVTRTRREVGPVPPLWFWDGFTDDGVVAEVGTYAARFRVRYTNGITSEVESDETAELIFNPDQSIVVGFDTDRPMVSPDNDGRDEAIEILLGVNRPQLVGSWSLRLVDAQGDEVRRYEDFRPPDTVVWDGTGSDGSIVEGRYVAHFDVAYTNRIQARAESIPIEVSLDPDATVGVRFAATTVSPDNDGVDETVDLLPTVLQPALVASWQIGIENSQGTEVYADRGTDAPPEAIEWDGTRPDGTVAEGDYTARFSVVYKNGVPAAALSDPVVVSFDPDATVDVRFSAATVSPDNDGVDESVDILPTVLQPALVASWRVAILGADGTEAFAGAGRGAPPTAVTWDGTRSDGSVEIGDYSATFSVLYTDGVDAFASSDATVAVRSDPSSTISIAFLDEQLSPDNDGRNETSSLRLGVLQPTAVAGWRVEIVNDEDSARRTYEGFRTLPETIAWNGRTDAGGIVPGSYRALLHVVYQNGLTAERAAEESIDLTFDPDSGVSVAFSGRSLTPDYDGTDETVDIVPSVVQPELVSGWTLQIHDSESRLTRRFEGVDALPEAVTWDGTDVAGRIVPGDYTATLSVRYRNGIEAIAQTPGGVSLSVDPDSTVSVTVTNEVFTPNGDGSHESTQITVGVAQPEAVREWSLRVVGDRHGYARTFAGGSTLPFTVAWYGYLDDNRIVDDTYRAEFLVVYENGLIATAQSPPGIDVVQDPLQVGVSVSDGLFSPDDDGRNETVDIDMEVRSVEQPIARWSLRILNPRGGVFRAVGGFGAPPEQFVWDGRSDSGELVESAMSYPVVFTVTDGEGRTRRAEDEVNVDILVVREGDRYRIRISNIHFSGNTAELFEGTEHDLSDNLRTLRRLSEILNAYPEHGILIEGHAAHVYTESAESMAREQEEELMPLSADRAEEVRRALVILGVDRDRITTIAYGGLRPLAPHTDESTRWKNRRVEFVLER